MENKQSLPYQIQIARLEALTPFLLAIHGAIMILTLGGKPTTWALLGITVLLGTSIFINAWPQTNLAVFRAIGLVIISLVLLFTTGNVNSFFLLWFFVIVSIYPIVLPSPYGGLLPLVIAGSYLTMLRYPSPQLPLVVIWARSILLWYIGMLTQKVGSILREYTAEIEALIQQASDGIFINDLEGNLIDVNESGCHMLGYTRDEIINKKVRDILILLPDSPPLRFTDLLDGKPVRRERIMRRKDGSQFVAEFSLKVIGSNKIQAIARDITDRKQAEEELRYMSHHDALTGLFNRAYFEEEMSRLERSREFPISILMADMDQLKKTNDNRGHSAGDLLLQRAAQILTASFRASDIIARIGGDEFAVLLPNTDPSEAKLLLKRVQQLMGQNNKAQPVIPVRLSLGVSTAVKSAPLLEVLKKADANLYRDKQNHRSTHKKSHP